MDTGYPERLGLDRPLILKQFETELNPGNQGKSYYIPMFFQLYPTFRTPTAPTKKKAALLPPPAVTEASILMLLPMAQASENQRAPALKQPKNKKGFTAQKKWNNFMDMLVLI
jgi:hypothetical protein